ncbi:MAG: hypothetical protein RL490_1178 [Pseudomonadota bacterium]|jgi:DNA-directed RNA polymerase specialized sigma24 family protein
MSLAASIAPHLPYLRRYARALCGSQTAGDGMVAATLEAIIADPSWFPTDVTPQLGLYRAFHSLRDLSEAAVPIPANDPALGESVDLVVDQRLSGMMPRSRQALLLSAMDGFTADDTAWLLDCTPGDVQDLIAEALEEIARQTRSRVLIIEDEPIIALHLESIVTDLGHEVTAIAATASEAVAAFRATTPGLVLADIQLADASSGIDAVRSILADTSVPVIFITAFPERLLTGERPEPTFLIAKPFQVASVEAAIAQALFFNSTARIAA